MILLSSTTENLCESAVKISGNIQETSSSKLQYKVPLNNKRSFHQQDKAHGLLV